MKKLLLVAGARPNFMKIAPLIEALREHNGRVSRPKDRIHCRLLHTGQHYDEQMSDSFFRDLELPLPDIYLGVGSGSHATQVARIMIEFEKICREERPDMVVVVGDVNSTAACALTAAKLRIAVAHVEAGLRSFDRTMPEEVNRLVTDHISDYLFTTSREANRNLLREGIAEDKIFFVGNVMIDTLLRHVKLARRSTVLKELGLEKRGVVIDYAVLTLHRPANVDDAAVLKGIIGALRQVSEIVPVVFPVHPRTAEKLAKFHLGTLVADWGRHVKAAKKDVWHKILGLSPLGYLDFLNLISRAKLVLTDSGGIQEETTILRVPCLTLRANTERPITVKSGTNMVVGTAPEKILETSVRVLRTRPRSHRTPEHWDGRAAGRIVEILTNRLQ
jgi:UDP-N-acetylglucosamine 2-epimerase (non-hydrolysing)